MSIVIQKKKLNAQAYRPKNRKLSHHERTDFQYLEYIRLFSDLDSNLQKTYAQPKLKEFKETLDAFYKKLKSSELLLSDLSSETKLSNDSQDVFLVQRANKVVILLADYLVNKQKLAVHDTRSARVVERVSVEVREASMMLIKILKVFAMINSTSATLLSNFPMFLEYLFRLISYDGKFYFKQVLCILEALVASNPKVITQELHPLIFEILNGLSRKNFARFSRIIALLVLENISKIDFKDLPPCQAEDKMMSTHSFLLSVPKLLQTYAIILEYLKEIIQCLTCATLENITKTIKYLKDSKIVRDSGLNLSFLKPLFEQCQISDNMMTEIFSAKFFIKFAIKKSNITEILFIISNLLNSKRKIDVQDRLNDLDFVNRVLDPFFDILFHPDLDLDANENLQAGSEAHFTSPLTTTRIQLLRIVINYCDRDSSHSQNKEVFISDDERELIYKQIIRPSLPPNLVPASNSTPFDSDTLTKLTRKMVYRSKDECDAFFTPQLLTENIFESVRHKGLLTKMFLLLKKVHANSSYYFWLTSCTEAFVRGFNPLHQMFVAHSGILYTLLSNIVKGEITKANNIQISYDLTGEIIKFNRYNMAFFETLCRSFTWTQRLIDQMERDVIDSNVLLRSLLLSSERFRIVQEEEKDPTMREKIAGFKKQLSSLNSMARNSLEWFNRLIDTVDSEAIDQDNICSINTALIIAIFADQRGELQTYLDSLVTEKRLRIRARKDHLHNLLKALFIWQRYYQSKTKDSFSLQFTTSIRFVFFQDIKKKIYTFLEAETNKD